MSRSASIVIPNWNGVHLLKRHLKKIILTAPEAQVIVSDDMSTDDSVVYLQKYFPEVMVVSNITHEGYASTVNAGVLEAKGDIVILLNTDVQPYKGFLEPLLVRFKDPNVFAVGCLEKSREGITTVIRGRGEAEWEKGFFIHRRGEVDQATTAWVSGGSGAFRKSIWQLLGGMDTMYNPCYWEDIDLSYRALKAGYELVFEAKSIVVHEHGRGAIKQAYSPLHVKVIAYRNQFLFIWKNLSDKRVLLDHIIWTPIRLVQAMIWGDIAMLIGFIWAVVHIPNALSSRVRSSRSWRVNDLSIPLQ